MDRVGNRITHRRTREGELVVRDRGDDDACLTERFAALLLTVTPNYRRNFLRLALRYANARAVQGIDPGSLFADGDAGFRADLARWHRNESGRYAWNWDGRHVEVYRENAVDEDVTDAVNLVLKAHRASSRRKYLGFLLSFINFELEQGEDPAAFMLEGAEQVRGRVEAWIQDELELAINFLNGQPDTSVDVSSEEGPVDHKALGIGAARQLYEALRKGVRVRSGPNPLDIDGLDSMDYQEKRQLAFDKYGKWDRLPRFFGAQFAIKGRTTYSPVPHDPTATYQVLRAAADECEGFPTVLVNILQIMDGEGPRHHDIKKKCFDAWAASDFGHWMWADDKGREDPQAKRIIFGPETATAIANRIDADHQADPDRPASMEEVTARVTRGEPVSPSMDQLRRLKQAGRTDVLALIPMFPSSLGTLYGYTGWNYWIRKATGSANGGTGAHIATSIGPVRPTAVWLRRSMFTERVVNLARKTNDVKKLKAGLTVIREDAGHRSDGPIYRYAHSVLPAIFGEGQEIRSAEARERVAAVRDGRPVSIPASETPQLPDASERRRGRARP